MTETHTIAVSCDQCSADLSPYQTGMPRDDIVVLSCENIARNSGGIVYMVAQQIPFEPKHFCDLDCTVGWIEANKKKHWFRKNRAKDVRS